MAEFPWWIMSASLYYGKDDLENDCILLQTQPSRNHNCGCCARGSIFERD